MGSIPTSGIILVGTLLLFQQYKDQLISTVKCSLSNNQGNHNQDGRVVKALDSSSNVRLDAWGEGPLRGSC